MSSGISRKLFLLVCLSFMSCVTLGAQVAQGNSAETPASPGRIGFEVAAGPAFEVFPPGGRASQRAVLGVPTMTIRLASWLDYAVEGHLSRHVTPVTGNVFGIAPFAFRVHTGGRTRVHLSLGAGQVWTDLAGIHGVEQRRNFITQLGAGIARVRANGSAVSLEARFFHLSNLGETPPDLGTEMVSVLVGYAFSRNRSE